MTLEERIAEAIDNALFDPQGIRKPTYADAARAVVAVLPNADVSDGIAAATEDELFHFERIASVKALLDAQAAAHAVQMDDAYDRGYKAGLATRGGVE